MRLKAEPVGKAARVLDLARQLEAMRSRLDELWLRPESVEEREEIDRRLRAIGDEVVRLISCEVAAGTVAYRSATAALRHANERLLATLREGAPMRDALESVARAVGLVSRVGSGGEEVRS